MNNTTNNTKNTNTTNNAQTTNNTNSIKAFKFVDRDGFIITGYGVDRCDAAKNLRDAL